MKTSDEFVTSRESSDASGGSRSSAQSIRDEIIDGLHKMGSNVKILKQGVHKIYEDLKPVPTYASPTKKGQQNKQTVSAADDENEEAKEANTAVEDLEGDSQNLLLINGLFPTLSSHFFANHKTEVQTVILWC